MVSMHQVVAFGLVAFVVIAIPGPSVVFTVGRALTARLATRQRAALRACTRLTAGPTA